MMVPVTVTSETVNFPPAVGNSMVVTRSVASFVSFHGDKSRKTPPMSTETAVSGSCGDPEKEVLSSSETQKSNLEDLEFERLPVG